jgi:Fe-S cluster biogenesis protein NfuA
MTDAITRYFGECNFPEGVVYSHNNGLERTPSTERTMKEEVQNALNGIRPQLQADGGDVELVEVTEDGTVKVRLQGHCKGCPMSQMTLKMGIERYLKSKLEGIKEVVSVP